VLLDANCFQVWIFDPDSQPLAIHIHTDRRALKHVPGDQRTANACLQLML
jgi:hypothetical protein